MRKQERRDQEELGRRVLEHLGLASRQRVQEVRSWQNIEAPKTLRITDVARLRGCTLGEVTFAHKAKKLGVWITASGRREIIDDERLAVWLSRPKRKRVTKRTGKSGKRKSARV